MIGHCAASTFDVDDAEHTPRFSLSRRQARPLWPRRVPWSLAMQGKDMTAQPSIGGRRVHWEADLSCLRSSLSMIPVRGVQATGFNQANRFVSDRVGRGGFMLRILLADGHPLFRMGVKELISEGFEAAEVGEADTGERMLALAQDREWDIALMDVIMPGKSGPEALKDLKRICPSLPVLVLATHHDSQYAKVMYKAGAHGYLTKATAPNELVTAIKAVLAGGSCHLTGAAEPTASPGAGSAEKPPHEKLSEREYQVMCLIAAGNNLEEIARALSLSHNTVSTYRRRIMEKMRMRHNSALTRYAIQNRLVD